MESGNGRNGLKGITDEVVAASRDGRHAIACVCGFRAAGFIRSEDSMAVLAQHLADDHKIVARQPGIRDWNIGLAQLAAKRCLERAIDIETRLGASPIATADGRQANQIDVAGQMVHFVREVSLALSSILDLMVNARTGTHCLHPEGEAPARPKGVPDATRQ